MKNTNRPLNESIPEDVGPGGVVVVTITANGRRKQFSFRSPCAQTLGSDEACEIRIESAEGVAPLHARFVWMNGWLVLEDLQTGDGTWMHGRAVERSVIGAGMRHSFEFGRSNAVTATVVVSSESEASQEPSISMTGAIPKSSTSWRDLPPTWPVPGTWGRNLAHKLVLKLLESHPSGATLEELDARLKELGHGRIESLKLLGWLHDYRGWGFRMNPETGRISVWSYLDHKESDSVERLYSEKIQRERAQLDRAKRALQRQREDLELRHRSTVRITPSRALPETGLDIIPEPERSVFRHIANHGQINEAEAMAILGGARQFRRFSMNFETFAVSCPFKVRIENAGNLKTYVREDEPSGLAE